MIGLVTAPVGGAQIAEKDVTLFAGYAVTLTIVPIAIYWRKGEALG